jgi:hypothetical protein
MRANSIFERKRLFVVLWALLSWATSSAYAQAGSAQLNVSLSVQSSITLIFQTNPAAPANGFCALGNSGTNNVTLNLGQASFPAGSDSLACVAYTHMPGAIYQVSSAFDVVVSKANSSSASYRLAAKVSTAPPPNVTWLVSNVTLTNTGFTQLDAADTYGTAVTKTLQVQVKNTVPPQVLAETITFLATAN